MTSPPQDPSVQRLIRIALALGELSEDVIFIGGSIASLLHTDSPFDHARATKDADGIIESSKYGDVEALRQKLEARGFKQDPLDTTHIHRWRSPLGDLLDLVPAGAHLGGSSQLWDQVAIETSATIVLQGTRIRYASAPGFLALKWAAYRDRGQEEPFASQDLEDILALLAARPSTIVEIDSCDPRTRAFVVEQTTELLANGDLPDLLAAHLNNAQDPAGAARQVHNALKAIVALGA